MARDRAHAAVRLLCGARVWGALTEGGGRPGRRLRDVAFGELIYKRTGVALQLRLAALEAGALRASLAQPAGHAGELIAVRAQRAELAVSAVNGRLQPRTLGRVRVADAPEPRAPRGRNANQAFGGVLALRADVDDLGLDAVELAQFSQRQASALAGDDVELGAQLAQGRARR